MNTIKPFITCLLILVTALSAEEPAGKANDVLPAACPKCQGALSTVPVLIGGPPSAEFAAQVTRGEALLGGCIGQDHQALICLECDRYLEEGAKIWQPLPGNFGAAKKLALLKGSSVTGTVKQSIGSFNLEGGGLTVGSTFELDLLNLPKERIDFKFQQTPESQPTSGGAILYRAPMKIEKVIQGRDRLGIFFSANDETGKFLIQVNVLGFEKGSNVYIQFYRDGGGGFIGTSMAEARGVLVDKPEPSPIKSSLTPDAGNPQTVEEASKTGASTAAKDIEAGVLRILYFGEPYPLKPLVDDATGYRVQVVGGCIATPQFSAEVEAYNDALRQWHASQPNSSTPKK